MSDMQHADQSAPASSVEVELTPPSEGSERPVGGALAAAISNRMVRILRSYSGRGPTKARTTVGRDHVLVVLHDTLTTAERTLVAHGNGELVLQTRHSLQKAMREEATRMVNELTGRTVIGFMSDNHIDPDLAAEVFVLEPRPDSAHAPAEAEVSV